MRTLTIHGFPLIDLPELDWCLSLSPFMFFLWCLETTETSMSPDIEVGDPRLVSDPDHSIGLLPLELECKCSMS